jgi:HSP20 family protein
MSRCRDGIKLGTSREGDLVSTQELTGHESAAELSDWPGSPLSALHPMAVTELPIRFEEYSEKNRYVVRLELPGIDLGKDLEVSIGAHVLSVRAERPLGPAEKCTSEFLYGTFGSHITLPAGTNDRDVAATYRNGILEVSVGWAEKPTARKVKVLTLADAE